MLTNQPNDKTKPSRQQKRKMERDFAKQQKQMKKYMQASVPRAEITHYLNSVQQRLAQMDLVLASLQHAILKKGVITEEDFANSLKFQQEKSNKFKEVMNSTAPYEERIKICKEFEIPIEVTNIPEQIKVDTKISTKEKLEFADKHNIPHELVNNEGFVSPKK